MAEAGSAAVNCVNLGMSLDLFGSIVPTCKMGTTLYLSMQTVKGPDVKPQRGNETPERGRVQISGSQTPVLWCGR